MIGLDSWLSEDIVGALRAAGARFAYLHGSRAHGTEHPGSDVDVAAYFGRRDVSPWDVRLPTTHEIDLLVLDSAPLELAGRVALHGRLLFERDPAERVEWEATTRKIYRDEKSRIARATRDFAAARRARGRR